MLKIILINIALISMFFCSVTEADSNNHLELGIGFITSSEQTDFLRETYSDYHISGGGAMINIDLGYAIGIGDHVSIVPKVSAAFYRIEFQSSYFAGTSNSHTNTYVMPGVAIRYSFSESGNGFYLGGQVANSNISNDLSRVRKIESDGQVTGVFIGYTFERGQIEFGSLSIPVIAESDSVPSEKYDFGGVSFTYRAVFK